MLPVDLPKTVERQLRNVVQSSYQGDFRVAMLVFLQLHEKYGWKEQLLKDVQSIRSEVRRKGGVKARAVDDAVEKIPQKFRRIRWIKCCVSSLIPTTSYRQF